MFYAHCVLAKKSPLRKVWLAAHWQTKLTKAHVFQTSLEDSVSLILEPRVKISLRTSGHLLLGVARILGLKARYLVADCSEAAVRIRMVFQPRIIDLPEERREATRNAITLPDSFHDLDSSLLGDEEIPEDFVLSVNYDGLTFGEAVEEDLEEAMETEEPELMREASKGFTSENNSTGSHKLREDDMPMENSFENMNSLIDEDGFGGIGVDEDVAFGDFGEMTEVEVEDAPATLSPPASPAPTVAPPSLASSYLSSDLTVLFHNDQEAFALAPVLTDNGGQGPLRRSRRKLLVDTVKTISGEDLKAGQRDYSCLVTSLTLAPPTRALMQWEARARAGALLLGPARTLGPPLLRDFLDSLRNTAEREEAEEQQSLGNMASPGDNRKDGSKRSMKRKKQQLANSQRKRSKDVKKALETSKPSEVVYGGWEDQREDGWQEDRVVLNDQEDQEVFEDQEDQEGFEDQGDQEVPDLGNITEDPKPTTEVEDDKATLLHQQLKENLPASFSLLAGRRSRKEVAGLFRAVLELQRRGVLELEQEEEGTGNGIVLKKGEGFGADDNQ